MENERRTRSSDQDPDTALLFGVQYEYVLSLDEMIEKYGNSLRIKPKNDNRGAERHSSGLGNFLRSDAEFKGTD